MQLFCKVDSWETNLSVNHKLVKAMHIAGMKTMSNIWLDNNVGQGRSLILNKHYEDRRY